MAMAKIVQTSFKNVAFKGCKLLGLHFETCNDFLFSVSFDTCTLNFSSFSGMDIRGTKFVESSLQDVDFRGTNLTNSVFDTCDLSKALFEKTNLERADFRSSDHSSIDPETNRLKKTAFSYPGVLGLLDRYDIVID